MSSTGREGAIKAGIQGIVIHIVIDYAKGRMIGHLLEIVRMPSAHRPTQYMPSFNTGVFAQQLANTKESTVDIINAAARAGQKGGFIAAKSMKSIRDNPCEQSPAPGCVTP